MSFQLIAIFSPPDGDSSADFIIRDFISDSDLTNVNNLDYIGSCVSHLICDGEKCLSSIVPNSSDYTLNCVHVLSIDSDSEEVYTH